MALATAILGAVQSVGNVVSSFVNAGAARYELQKGLEVGKIEFEQAKTLQSYATTAQNKNLIIYLIIGIGIVTAIIVIFKNRA